MTAQDFNTTQKENCTNNNNNPKLNFEVEEKIYLKKKKLTINEITSIAISLKTLDDGPKFKHTA